MDQRRHRSSPSPATERLRGIVPAPPLATLQQHWARMLADSRMLLLFETPSGFAILDCFESLIEKPNALEEIWTHFILSGKAMSVVWLRDFQTFEDKSSAINQNTGVDESLTEMIMKYHYPGQRMAVGKPEYKKIIEESLKITCVFGPTVMELMWGIQICMPSLVPSEKAGLTEDDLLPMSHGLKEVLSRYDCDYVNPKMLNEAILVTAYVLYECDSFESEKSEELDHLAALIKVVSGIDTEGWCSLKIANALKSIWGPEDVWNSSEIISEISEDDVSRLVNDADKYKVKLVKGACLELSRQIEKAHGVRLKKKKLLKKYVEQAKRAYEAQKLAESVSAN